MIFHVIVIFIVIFWFLVDSYCIVEVGIKNCCFTLKACYNHIGSLKTPIFIGFILYYYYLIPDILGGKLKSMFIVMEWYRQAPDSGAW